MVTVPARWCNLSCTNLYKDNLQNKSHPLLGERTGRSEKDKTLAGRSKGYVNEGQTS